MLSDRSIRRHLSDGSLEIEDRHPDAIQPAGVDLRAGHDYKEVETGEVHQNPVVSQSGGRRFVLKFEPGQLYRIHTVERLSLPADMKGHISPRHSIERKGLQVSSGPVDPGFEGVLELSVVNNRRETVRVEAGEPIVELELTKLDEAAESPYGESGDEQFYGESKVSASGRDPEAVDQ